MNHGKFVSPPTKVRSGESIPVALIEGDSLLLAIEVSPEPFADYLSEVVEEHETIITT
jgi:hypothetical protein